MHIDTTRAYFYTDALPRMEPHLSGELVKAMYGMCGEELQRRPALQKKCSEMLKESAFTVGESPQGIGSAWPGAQTISCSSELGIGERRSPRRWPRGSSSR